MEVEAGWVVVVVDVESVTTNAVVVDVPTGGRWVIQRRSSFINQLIKIDLGNLQTVEVP